MCKNYIIWALIQSQLKPGKRFLLASVSFELGDFSAI